MLVPRAQGCTLLRGKLPNRLSAYPCIGRAAPVLLGWIVVGVPCI